MPVPVIAGVCSGLAVHLNANVKLVRLAMVVLTMFGVLSGIFFYIWLWATIPQDGSLEAQMRDQQAEQPTRLAKRLPNLQADPPGNSRRRANQQVSWQLAVAGGAVLVIAVGIVIARWRFATAWDQVFSIAMAVLGIAIVWIQAPKIGRHNSWQTIALVSLGTLALVIGVTGLVTRDWSRPVTAVGLGVGILATILVMAALLPIWLRINSILNLTREQEARESERADIAAHLHDSVLQTLTLIRANADNPEKVSSLALTQERELRSWLYTSRESAATSTAQQLRYLVEQAESAYGKEISLVTVGDAVPGPAELAAIAAAGEATTNAVRHGQPPFSVYQEIGVGTLDIYVKDAGAGFAIDAIPADRHGVRDSIVGRVERVGGQVHIRTAKAANAADRRPQGTEIHIQVPLTQGADPDDSADYPTG